MGKQETWFYKKKIVVFWENEFRNWPSNNFFFENRLSRKWFPENAGQIRKTNLHCQGSHCPASPGTSPFWQSDGHATVPSATPALKSTAPTNPQPPASSGARPFQQPIGSCTALTAMQDAWPRCTRTRPHQHAHSDRAALQQPQLAILPPGRGPTWRGKWCTQGVVLHDPYPLEFGLPLNNFCKPYSCTMKFQSRSSVKQVLWTCQFSVGYLDPVLW